MTQSHLCPFKSPVHLVGVREVLAWLGFVPFCAWKELCWPKMWREMGRIWVHPRIPRGRNFFSEQCSLLYLSGSFLLDSSREPLSMGKWG